MTIELRAAHETDTLRIHLAGPLDRTTVPQVWERAADLARGTEGGQILVDLEEVTSLDTAGVAFLLELLRRATEAGRPLRFVGLREEHRRLFDLLHRDRLLAPHGPPDRSEPGPLTMIGDATLRLWRDGRDFLAFIGDVTVEGLASLAHPRRVRWRETLYYAERVGVDAIPIITLISLLLGLILGFQAALQLRQFGANIYVADLVGVAVTRELGPLMAAIIVAGRSGSAFAAEIGTMKVAEEVAALETMGLDRTRFLVLPKILALVAMMPCLTLLADGVGLLGGLFVGVFQLDLSMVHYLDETRTALALRDIFSGLFKSVVFALLIGGIGCFRGLQVTTDAASVGRSTTSAVVTSLFAIIAMDALFTLLFYTIGV